MSILCVELTDTKSWLRSQESPLTSGSCGEGEEEDESLFRQQTLFLELNRPNVLTFSLRQDGSACINLN